MHVHVAARVCALKTLTLTDPHPVPVDSLDVQRPYAGGTRTALQLLGWHGIFHATGPDPFRHCHAQTPTCISCPSARSLLQASLTARREGDICLLYTSPSPRDRQKSRMPSSA